MIFKIFKSIKNLITQKTKEISLSASIYVWIDQVSYGKHQSTNFITTELNKLPIYWITSVGHILIDGQAFETKLRMDLTIEGTTILFDRMSTVLKRDNGEEYLLWCQRNYKKFIKSNAKTTKDIQELIFNKFYEELDTNKFSYKEIKRFLFLNKEKVKKDFFSNFLINKQLQNALMTCNIKKENQYLKAAVSQNILDFNYSMLNSNSTLIQKTKNINKI